MSRTKSEVSIKSLFATADEYFQFAKKYNVWGGAAITLKKQLDKQSYIPEPKIRG